MEGAKRCRLDSGGRPWGIGLAACLTDDGRRTWGTLEERSVLDAMTREEFCGRRGRLDGEGRLSVEPVPG